MVCRMTRPGSSPWLARAGGLREELEGPFGGAEVGYAEADVGVDEADEGDVGDVVAFGDHLGADQDVVVPSRKPVRMVSKCRLVVMVSRSMRAMRAPG
jgi:hypothetical protein